jgi:hypothetical protein
VFRICSRGENWLPQLRPLWRELMDTGAYGDSEGQAVPSGKPCWELPYCRYAVLVESMPFGDSEDQKRPVVVARATLNMMS